MWYIQYIYELGYNCFDWFVQLQPNNKLKAVVIAYITVSMLYTVTFPKDYDIKFDLDRPSYIEVPFDVVPGVDPLYNNYYIHQAAKLYAAKLKRKESFTFFDRVTYPNVSVEDFDIESITDPELKLLIIQKMEYLSSLFL